MKVFLSHSSREKWIALKISEDLEKLGLTVFLAEKNMTTGMHINESIRVQLNDCDDFLLIISPASLRSHWVLIELGEAIALGKRIIPVLAFLGMNEVPSPINQYLARDLNDIDKYYCEIQHQLKGKRNILQKPEMQSSRQEYIEEHKYKCGERVIIDLTKIPDDRHDLGWNEEMSKYMGCTVTVNFLPEVPRDTVRITEDGGDWLWATEWLTPEVKKKTDSVQENKP